MSGPHYPGDGGPKLSGHMQFMGLLAIIVTILTLAALLWLVFTDKKVGFASDLIEIKPYQHRSRP